MEIIEAVRRVMTHICEKERESRFARAQTMQGAWECDVLEAAAHLQGCHDICWQACQAAGHMRMP